MDLSFTELRELVAALDQTDIAELTLKGADFELTLRKPSALSPPVAFPEGMVVREGTPTGLTTSPAPPKAPPSSTAEMALSAPPPITPPIAANLVEITSPVVGTFYRSPAPDEASFVEVGDRIHLSQIVCIFEAMKVMNEIEAEVAGEIVEILVQNGEPVEYGQPLMRVKPS